MLAYNIGRYIETARKGVVQQKTNYQIQLVIAEDCSTDNTLEICTRYKELYPDVITLVAHEKNRGLQRNFMSAHEHCTGEYIAICDGDDYWIDRKKLQRMTDFMDKHPDFAICFHRVINYYEEDGSKSLSNGGQKQITDIKDLARGNYITNSSSLFRRNYYPQVPEWFGQINLCDYAMHMLNAQHGKIYYFKRPMAVYRKHSKGIWSERDTDKKLAITLHVRELLMDYFKDQVEILQGLRQSHKSISLNLIRYYMQKGDTHMVTVVEDRILTYNPGIERQQLKKEAADTSLTLKQRLQQSVMRCMKQGRVLVSRLMPLPGVR